MLNLALQIKIVLMLIAGVNLLVFHFTGLARLTDTRSTRRRGARMLSCRDDLAGTISA